MTEMTKPPKDGYAIIVELLSKADGGGWIGQRSSTSWMHG